MFVDQQHVRLSEACRIKAVTDMHDGCRLLDCQLLHRVENNDLLAGTLTGGRPEKQCQGQMAKACSEPLMALICQVHQILQAAMSEHEEHSQAQAKKPR